VSRSAVEEAYGYITGEQDVLPLNGAELARELVRAGAALKHKQPKGTVTDVKTEIDDEDLLWLTVEFDHNPFGAHRYLIGKIERMAMEELPEWLKPYVPDNGGVVDVDNPDWMDDLDDCDDEWPVEDEGEEEDDCAGPRPKFGEPGWLHHLLFCDEDDAQVSEEEEDDMKGYEGC
jgi:hypothetical protein